MSGGAQGFASAARRISRALETPGALETRPLIGRVAKVSGVLVEATLPGARLGEICELREPGGFAEGVRYAEVVGLRDGAALLSVMGDMTGLSTRTQATPTGGPLMAGVGPELLGRVLDGLGRPIDMATKGPLRPSSWRPVMADAPDPLARAPIHKPLPLGIPAFDALNTCGEGQRIGLFGEPGVGKSTLMAAIAKASSADVAVIALVGERGREVSEFIEEALGPEGLARSVVVAATSDRPSMERLKAPFVATAIAEYFRDQGKKVILLMDSITRLARAQREIGLAAGEPPARRAFPPSVFALMPRLIERAGAAANGGSITAFYTVLMEDDGVGDPVAEEARALLDGHIVLSRKIAEAGRYPAIDVLASRSRVMTRVTSAKHRAGADRLRALLSRWKDVELLVRMGEHRHGADPLADEAIAKKDEIENFIYRSLSRPAGWEETRAKMFALTGAQGEDAPR